MMPWLVEWAAVVLSRYEVGKDGKDHTEHGDGGQGGMTGGGCNVRKLQSPPLMQSPPLNQQPPPTKKHVREYIVPAKAKRARLQSPKKVVGKGSKEHEHGGEGCTGGTGWDTDDWGPRWPHSGDDTWMGDQYDGGCWCMQRGSYIGR